MRYLRHIPAREEQEARLSAPPYRALVAVGLLFVFAVLIVALDVPVCPVAAMTGIPCPGCGLTRAALSLLSGNVSAAIHFHPLVFVVLPTLAALLARNGGAALTHSSRPVSRRENRIWMGIALLLLTALVALWIARFFGFFGGPVAIDRPLFRLIR